jgi:hypothetical protein
MFPLSGRSAICADAQANQTVAGLTTGQRGYPDTNATDPGYFSSNHRVDAGAAQSNYSPVGLGSWRPKGYAN